MSLNQLINPSGAQQCTWANYECYNLTCYQGITTTNLNVNNMNVQGLTATTINTNIINGVTANINNINTTNLNLQGLTASNITANNIINTPHLVGITANFTDKVTTPNLYTNSLYYTGATGQQMTANVFIVQSGTNNFRTVISNDDVMTRNENNYFKQTGASLNNFVLASGTTCGQGGVNILGGVTCNNASFTIFCNSVTPIGSDTAASFTVYNNLVNPNSKILAFINQYTGDFDLGGAGGKPFTYVFDIQNGRFRVKVSNQDKNHPLTGTIKVFCQIFN